jgi:hypothetical protein
MLKPRWTVLAAMILMAALSRLVPHPPNLASVSAVALFGGAYFSDRRMAYLVPLTALLLSDLALGFYRGMGAADVRVAGILRDSGGAGRSRLCRRRERLFCPPWPPGYRRHRTPCASDSSGPVWLEWAGECVCQARSEPG